LFKGEKLTPIIKVWIFEVAQGNRFIARLQLSLTSQKEHFLSFGCWEMPFYIGQTPGNDLKTGRTADLNVKKGISIRRGRAQNGSTDK
jgi:hypothetical protein